MDQEQGDFEYGLGRLPAADPADMAYHMRTILAPTLAAAPLRNSRYWNAEGWWGNQGSAPQCVAYAWTHFLEDGPVTHSKAPPPLINPALLYGEAQKVDEWPGEGYDGTSVRAAAKVLQSLGHIGTYSWAWDLDTLVDAVLTAGPVVMGTNWYGSMFKPDPSTGLVKIEGAVIGGHAWEVNGVNRSRAIARCKNSWGRDWGKKGHFFLRFAELARLIAEDGEACIAIEVKDDE